MSEPYQQKPGFVRVWVNEKQKTTRIREQHARNPNFMIKHGLTPMPDPQTPPMLEKQPEVKPQITKASPVKVKQHGS